MEIARVVQGDLEAVESLIRIVSKTEVLPHFNEQGKIEYLARVLADIETTFNESCFYSVKLVSAGKLIGFAALRDGNYLTHLFVARDRQRKGAGKRLLDHVLFHTDAKEINLRSSVNARFFYLAYGFDISGEEEDLNGIRFIPMRLLLS